MDWEGKYIWHSVSFMLNTYATSIFPSGFLVAPVTLVFSLNLSPCFWRIRWKFLEISMSIPIPPTWPMNSTAVTSAPRRCQTEPCSHNNIGKKILKSKLQISLIFTTDCKFFKSKTTANWSLFTNVTSAE